MDTKKKYLIGIWICVILIIVLEGLLYFHSNWKTCLMIKPAVLQNEPGKVGDESILLGSGFEFKIIGEYQVETTSGEKQRYYELNLGDDFNNIVGYVPIDRCAVKMGKLK